MLISILAGEAAAVLFVPAPRIAYSLASAVVPLILYINSGGEKISAKTDRITYKVVLTAVFLWAGGNLLNSGVNLGLEKLGFSPLVQLEPEDGSYRTAMNIFCVCVAAPICEEIVYRGIVLKSAYVYGRETAVLVSALLFALAHGSITVFAMPFVYGIVCGAIAMKTGSIAPGILIHCICNTLSYAMTKTEFPGAAVVTAVFGAVYLIYLAVRVVKNFGAVRRAVSGFLYSMDFWWIPVFIKVIISNIIYHGG